MLRANKLAAVFYEDTVFFFRKAQETLKVNVIVKKYRRNTQEDIKMSHILQEHPKWAENIWSARVEENYDDAELIFVDDTQPKNEVVSQEIDDTELIFVDDIQPKNEVVLQEIDDAELTFVDDIQPKNEVVLKEIDDADLIFVDDTQPNNEVVLKEIVLIAWEGKNNKFLNLHSWLEEKLGKKFNERTWFVDDFGCFKKVYFMSLKDKEFILKYKKLWSMEAIWKWHEFHRIKLMLQLLQMI